MSSARIGAAARALCLSLVLSGCAHLVPETVALRSAWPSGVPQQVELTHVPFFPQADYQCGPAALATVLAHGGLDIRPEALVEQVWLPARGGSLQIEMLTAARRQGFVAYRLTPSFPDLLREVAAGHPVLVLQDVGLLTAAWHYAVVVGFDYPSGTVFLRSGVQQRLAMPFTAFERSWIKSGYWAFVAMPPHQVAATAQEARWSEAVLATARAAPRQDLARAWTAALVRWPGSLPAAVGLANEKHRRGELEAAAAVLGAALAHHPGNALVINNLAQTLSDLGRHAAALGLLEDVATGPENPHHADLMATRALVQQRSRSAASGTPPQRAPAVERVRRRGDAAGTPR